MNVQDLVDETIEVKAVTLLVMGRTKTQIAKELGLSLKRLDTVLKSDAAIAALRSLKTDAMERARASITHSVAELAPKIVEVLKAALEKNNLNAIPYALKILGFSEEQQQQQESSITVILPGGSMPTLDITPKKEVKE